MSTRTKQCPKCHTPMDVSALAPGERCRCPGCGQVLRIPTAPAAGAAPPPLPPTAKAASTPQRVGRRRLSERRESTATSAPPIEEVNRRFAAAKLCRSAFYIGIGSAIAYLFAGLFVLPVALVGLVLGVVGLVKLSAVGPGRPVSQCDPGRERLAARMAKVAPSRAWIGIGIGVAVAGIVALTIWSGMQERARPHEEEERFIEGLDDLDLTPEVRERLRRGNR